MNLDDCNSSSSSTTTSSSSSSSTSSSHSPSSSRSSSPQPTTAVNPTIVEESLETNTGIEITSKEDKNTDHQQNDNLNIDNNINHHLYQKQLSPIREESNCLQEESLESSSLIPPSSPPPQSQHLHKQSSSSPPPPLLLSSPSTSPSSSQQPLTNMSTDQILTDLMTSSTSTTKQTASFPSDDCPPSPHASTHSTSCDDTTNTTPVIESEVSNLNPDFNPT